MTTQRLVLAITVIAAISLLALKPSILGNANAQIYGDQYGYDNYNYNNYYPEPKSLQTDIQKIKCVNSNINVNGIDITQIPQDGTGVAAANEEGAAYAANTQNGNGLADRINIERNLVNICVNVNLNEQVQENPLTLMTWNIYQGADLSPIFTATNFNEFVTAVGAAYNRVQATNFVERADSIADEIRESQPDLIGLQEVILLRTQIPSDGPTTPATNISFDYLQILIDSLAEHGLIYEPIVVQTGTDIEVPGLTSTGLVDIRLTDRDVILVRADKDFTLSNIQGAQFAAKLPVTTLFGSINIPRSWVSVDITFNTGDKTRLVSTHLEPLSPVIQGLQADELLNGPGNTNLPVVFIGDFNSNADGTGTPTYSKIINAGFIDAWTIAGKGNGFTCCQDEDLLNQISSLEERIDLILLRGNFGVNDIELVGNSQNDRTISGLWPSDHAGVVANLKLNN